MPHSNVARLEPLMGKKVIGNRGSTLNGSPLGWVSGTLVSVSKTFGIADVKTPSGVIYSTYGESIRLFKDDEYIRMIAPKLTANSRAKLLRTSRLNR